jgi:uncharacterized metal-binding protein
MPSGKVHAITTCLAAGTLSPVVYLATQSIPTALAFAGGCVIGLVVTPDLDVRQRDTHSESIMRRAGGCIGAIWNMLWIPYAYLIPRHRHPLSHWPVIGTAIRLAYLLAVPALAWWVIGHIIALPPLPHLALTPLTWWAVGSLALMDSLHWLMDCLF